MKKFCAAALALALALSLCACGNKTDEQSGAAFSARIDAVTDTTLTVTPEISSAEHKTADSFVVSTPEGTKYTDANGNSVDRSYFTPGEEISVSYDGSIAETYPAQITAFAVSLMYDTVLVPQTTDAGQTMTITREGKDKTVAADRVALKDFFILVPAEGWLAAHGEDTDVGPLVIYPQGTEGVSLTFSVQQMTDVDGAKKLLSNSYDGLDWSAWPNCALENACAANSGGTVLYVAAHGDNAVTIECTSPQGSEYAVILSQIAATLQCK